MARSVITRADASPSYIIPTNGPAFLRMHHQSAINLTPSLSLSFSLMFSCRLSTTASTRDVFIGDRGIATSPAKNIL